MHATCVSANSQSQPVLQLTAIRAFLLLVIAQGFVPVLLIGCFTKFLENYGVVKFMLHAIRRLVSKHLCNGVNKGHMLFVAL